MSIRARPRSLSLGALHCRRVLKLIFLLILCGTITSTSILRDDGTWPSSIDRRDPGSDRKHSEHSPGQALAKVRAQQR